MDNSKYEAKMQKTLDVLQDTLGGIRAGREPQAEKADADAEEREQHGEVGAVGAERPAARAIGRKNKARKLQIGFPFKKNNRIITDFSAKTTAISHHSAKSRSM